MERLLKERKNRNFKEIEDSSFIFQNELDKASIQHGVTYGDFKDLPGRTAYDKVLRVKHLILLKIQNMMDIKKVWLQWFKIF